jgi:hypothetical protein
LSHAGRREGRIGINIGDFGSKSNLNRLLNTYIYIYVHMHKFILIHTYIPDEWGAWSAKVKRELGFMSEYHIAR